MKEAIGGTWLFGIVIVFIAVFTCFVSVTTNWSRCYKIKDEILAAVEYYKGINSDSVTRANEYLNGIGYSSAGECPAGYYAFLTSSNSIASSGSCSSANYCISKSIATDADLAPIGHPDSAYYSVIVFFRLNWPVLQSFFTINISGETSIIYLPTDFSAISSDTEAGSCEHCCHG